MELKPENNLSEEDDCLKQAETQEETSFSVKPDGEKSNIKKKDGAVKSAVLTGNVNTDTSVEDGEPQKTMHKMYRDMDSLLGFGKFQHFQIWVFQTLISIIGGYDGLQLIFMVSDPPDWYCAEGEEKCPSTGEVCEGGNIVYNTTHENYLNSLTVQQNWVCDQKLRGSNVLTAVVAGVIFNSLIFGQLSDKIGRRAILHITNILTMVIRLISYHLTEYYYLFLVLSALGTNFEPIGSRAGLTMVPEYCNELGRKVALISGWVWWVVGQTSFPFLAMYANNWYWLSVGSTLCHIFIVLLYPFVPESPRLLYSQKKYDRTAEVLTTIRRINKDEPIPDMKKFLEEMAKSETEETSTLVIMSMFKERNLLRLLICMATLWSVNDYFYFGGLLNAQNLAGNMFVNMSLTALTELPSVFIGQYLIDRFGRRWSHVGCMLTATGFFLINLCIINEAGTDNAVFGISLAAKTVSNVSWYIMWYQALEVFPSCLRNTGINMSKLVSLTVKMSTPYTVKLDKVDKRLPYVIFVCLGVIGTIASFLGIVGSLSS
ncbi:solute carrier family 22 member 15 [Eurytemora carolleeae]|uniref:solute carrier family 22 member 15 n=1 Tax=Eurytemora carolleeae TaxID=1294199 RepID=UPI000C773B27|nr:solute carrier family 22 member 15 [Eurytemora carolleeae]|eukprot:XP_023349584.1 solute carrier family 22 member 15-like [Eurytemora affinis]